MVAACGVVQVSEWKRASIRQWGACTRASPVAQHPTYSLDCLFLFVLLYRHTRSSSRISQLTRPAAEIAYVIHGLSCFLFAGRLSSGARILTMVKGRLNCSGLSLCAAIGFNIKRAVVLVKTGIRRAVCVRCRRRFHCFLIFAQVP